ncbi:tetratricopeptide repeat protein [bacterium]|nr:tetratricopeptide repeat protein [bacterium]
MTIQPARRALRTLASVACVACLVGGVAAVASAKDDERPSVEAVPQGNDKVWNAIRLGDQYRTSGLPEKAAEEYQKALDVDPENTQAYARLGYALVEAKQFEKAVKIYQRYVALAPDDCNSHSSLGFAYLQQGLTDQAITAYEKALEVCPDDPNSYTNLGKVYAQSGSYPIEAIEAFRRSVELNPNDITGYENLAKLYSERKLYPEAIRMYEAILARPDHAMGDRWVVWANGRIAAMYRWADAYAQAIPHYRAVMDSPVANEDQKTRAIRGLAISYEQTQQVALAIELYQDLIRQVPGEAGYYYRLGELLSDVGRYEDAIETVKAGLKADQACSAHGLYVIGEAYEKLGGVANFKRAEREFKKAVACGGDPQLMDRARQQIDRQRQLIRIEELKRKKEQQGY